MNVFSSDEFLGALADVYHPGADARVAVYRVEDRMFRLLRVGKSAVTTLPMIDFWEPLTESPTRADAVLTLRSLARVALTVKPVESAAPDLEGMSPAPFVELVRFSSFDDYREKVLRPRRPKLLGDSRRQRGRLERGVGSIEFTADDRDDAVLAKCIELNSARFRSSARLHRDPRPAALILRLRDAGVARVSSIQAGDALLAAGICLVQQRRTSFWIAAYDDTFRSYSPGRLLLEHLIETSFAAGDREFDFLSGNERYKWIYATHTRLIGPLGPQPRIPAAVMAVRKRLRLGRKYRKLRRTLRR